MRQRWTVFFLILLSLKLQAAPQSLEVWFLSAPKVAELQRLINDPLKITPLFTELQCQQMGDYCFDPQFGLYKKDDPMGEVSARNLDQEKSPGIPSAESIDRELVNCDPKNYFDVFCGKSAPVTKTSPAKLELFIDTSSSMREMDFSDKEGGCFRKSLVKKLDQHCSFNQKVNVMMFDTSIKQAGTMDSLCNNQGLNDYKKLIDWIERSQSKKLVVITDIYEFHKEFSDYVESRNGTFRGDKQPLTAKDLLKLVDQLAKTCQ
jgi:hypothetical protein